MPYESNKQLFPIWKEPKSIWEKTGLSPRAQRLLDASLFFLMGLFLVGWAYSAVDAYEEGRPLRVAMDIGAAGGALGNESNPAATFALIALAESLIDMEDLRGASGELRVAFHEPGENFPLPDSATDVEVGYLPAGTELPDSAVSDGGAAAVAAAGNPTAGEGGVWNVLLRMGRAVRNVPDFNVLGLVSASRIDDGYLGDYRIGQWPDESGVYSPPRGLVQVVPENVDTRVSTHFRLGDFLTKGQADVWPKYVVLSPRLLDKLELTIQQLESEGHAVEDVFVVSGFRTPWYNRAGGNTQGRGSLSRHMYGDAADIAIDNNGDNCMDDLTGDGRATIADARVVAEAAEQVERDYPHLTGGIGIYAPVPGSHCGMVHIDTRGNRARW